MNHSISKVEREVHPAVTCDLLIQGEVPRYRYICTRVQIEDGFLALEPKQVHQHVCYIIISNQTLLVC